MRICQLRRFEWILHVAIVTSLATGSTACNCSGSHTALFRRALSPADGPLDRDHDVMSSEDSASVGEFTTAGTAIPQSLHDGSQGHRALSDMALGSAHHVEQATAMQVSALQPRDAVIAIPVDDSTEAIEAPLPFASRADDARLAAAIPNPVPINLATALEITAGRNPQIGYAQQRIQEAYARLEQAEVLWLPSIRAGGNYNKHDGVIQDVAGNMVTNSRSSVYTGLGAQAVGAGSPAIPGMLLNVHLRDALFQPRIAEQVLGARQEALQASNNDAALETALRYMDLLEAVQVLAVAQETLSNAERLRKVTQDFAESGQGLQADADRAMAELSARQIEVLRATENVRVASIRLARNLSRQDQSLTFIPQESSLVPIELVGSNADLADLVASGLTNRPELAESRYLVGEAVERLRRERHAPLVPSLLLGLSYGGNGGSPNSTISDFGDRVDFDASMFWEVRNLGLGERYLRDSARSQVDQARWRQVQIMDQVASEVAESHAQVASRQAQLRFAESAIAAALDSYRRNLDRIQNGQGLPIETLQSIQALDQARRQYARTVADYNRSQFQLQRALGWPITSIDST